MAAGPAKRAANEAWQSGFLGLSIMVGASLLWSVTSVLMLLSASLLHTDAFKTVLILNLAIVPGAILVGSTLGYWMASARPSPIAAAATAAVASVTINSLFVSFATRLSTVASNWAGATIGGAVLGLTAAPFWFVGALVLYDRLERRGASSYAS